MKTTCAIHVIVTKSSVAEEGNVLIMYDHRTQHSHFRVHAHCVLALWRRVRRSHWLGRIAALPHWGTRPPLVSHGVISSRSLTSIPPETRTLQATTAKHARRVRLAPGPRIDIKLSRGASANKARQNGEHSDGPVKGHRRPGPLRPGPTCGRRFKELFDSLTFLLTHFLPTPFIPRTLSSPLFSFLSRPD